MDEVQRASMLEGIGVPEDGAGGPGRPSESGDTIQNFWRAWSGWRRVWEREKGKWDDGRVEYHLRI